MIELRTDAQLTYRTTAELPAAALAVYNNLHLEPGQAKTLSRRGATLRRERA